jgi:hypothetical protein
MVVGNNPTKVIGSVKFLPALQILIDGYAKENPPTRKMLPLELDVPQLLVDMGYSQSGTAHTKAIPHWGIHRQWQVQQYEANGTIQTRRCNLLQENKVSNCGAFPKMRRTSSCYPLTAQL